MDGVQWLDSSYAVRDGDGFLIHSQSGDCRKITRVSRAGFRRFIEEGKRLLADADAEDNVVRMRSG